MENNTALSQTSTKPPTSPSKQRPFDWLLGRLLPVGIFLASGFLLIVIVGIAQRIGWLQTTSGDSLAAAAPDGSIYTCPMHPQIRQPMPGRCPICSMELVVASSTAANDVDEWAVLIEPAQRRLANIETATVKAGLLEDSLQTVGVIAIDESRQATIAAYIDGRLERLFADYTGVEINQGDHLAVIYSPQLYSAQIEYLEARRALGVSSGLPAVRQAQEALADNTLQRLREFGMTDAQVSELEKTGTAQSRLTIYAPQGGTVLEKLAIEGNYVKAGDPIYRIAELSTIWLTLKLFPEDAARIRFGQSVEAVVQSIPSETLVGRVAFIDPTVDPQTRTVGVRVELLNDQRRLRPGDYAHARISLPIGPQGKVFDTALAGKWISPMHPQIIENGPGQCPICGMELVPTSNYGFANEPVPQPKTLHVPRSAVLLAGENSIVYVETEAGRFEIRPVTIGPILRDKIVILDGLESGESVATAGNFLIDSQMQLAGKPSLIDPARAIARSKEPAGPLMIAEVAVKPIGGKAGEDLESLYAAYFKVQSALAADKKPPSRAAQDLHRSASSLAAAMDAADSVTELATEISAHSEHLHHQDLATARESFKPISHAVVRLAAQARGKDAVGIYTHFYCPMVPGGGGDWLQSDSVLLNPYFGSEMLKCGEKVAQFPLKGTPAKKTDQPKAEPASSKKKGQA